MAGVEDVTSSNGSLATKKNVARSCVCVQVNVKNNLTLYTFSIDDLKPKMLRALVNSFSAYKEFPPQQIENIIKEICGANAHLCSFDRKFCIGDYIYHAKTVDFITALDVFSNNSAPVWLWEVVIDSLLNSLRTRLCSENYSNANFVDDIIESTKSGVLLEMLYGEDFYMQTVDFVKHIYGLGKLDENIIAKSLLAGNLVFFENSLSVLTGRSISDIKKILDNTADDYLIRNILREANVSNNIFPLIILCINIIKELVFEQKEKNAESFKQKVIERVLTSGSVDDSIDVNIIKYLMLGLS